VIDWVTATLPCVHDPIDSGYVCKVLPGGELDWQTPCRHSVEGSYSANISVKSMGGNGRGQATELLISGNPAKFLQGHNVFGSDDLLSLMYDTYIKICASLSLEPTLDELRKVKEGDYVIKNIDINRSFELPTRADVLAWIRAMEYKSKTRHGRPSTKGGTLYFGKATPRWKIKVYSKGEELDAGKKHELPAALMDSPIKAWANNKLRIELTLLKKELQTIGIGKALDLTVSMIDELYRQYIGRIEMSEQITLSSEDQLALPTKYQSTYLHWYNGVDLRSILTKATYYRHRKALLEYGIDIALRKETKKRPSNVVPLIRILEAQPASIPQWAFDQGLVHPSAA
jgi:II/X family phage/plasmid replication protein